MKDDDANGITFKTAFIYGKEEPNVDESAANNAFVITKWTENEALSHESIGTMFINIKAKPGNKDHGFLKVTRGQEVLHEIRVNIIKQNQNN